MDFAERSQAANYLDEMHGAIDKELANAGKRGMGMQVSEVWDASMMSNERAKASEDGMCKS